MIYNTVSIKCRLGIKTYGYQKYHLTLNISAVIVGQGMGMGEIPANCNHVILLHFKMLANNDNGDNV